MRSRDRRISKVFKAYLCIGWCLACMLCASHQAHGSCGDYLQHGPTDSFQQLGDLQQVPGPLESSPNSRCRYGNCGGLPPVDLLSGAEFRVEDRNSEVAALHGVAAEELQVAFGRASDDNFRSQTFLEVNVPPPKS